MLRTLPSLAYLAIPLALYPALTCAHDHQEPLVDYAALSSVNIENAPTETWLEKYGKQIDQVFSGPLAFSHLQYTRCLEDTNTQFDIALLRMPFDTGVTYRPGARFGPFAIRSGSRRQRETRGYTLSWKNNPYEQGSKIIDCGDVPVSPFDNALAVDQMEVAYSTSIVGLESERPSFVRNLAKDGKEHPRIVSLGGDHTIVLPILRALYKVYGPISVIHFDAHLDTWPSYPGQSSDQSRVTHGTFFYLAQEEGLMSNTSIHAGIRCKLQGIGDLENDQAVGFQLISTDDIDDLGVAEVIRRIRARVGNSPVYLSLDIDVIDPGLAPATGTPEAGGWTTREVKRIIRGLAGLNFVGADVVEVAPAYDNAEITAIAAADIVHDFLSMFLTQEPRRRRLRIPQPGTNCRGRWTRKSYGYSFQQETCRNQRVSVRVWRSQKDILCYSCVAAQYG
ncbi:Arginase/deacetylase [Amylocystis lapponica]|nr:Arginase/deacetylase [Amylocystis lapponica]